MPPRARRLKDTFFSANVKYYEFSPNYDVKSTFQEVFDYGGTQYNHREEPIWPTWCSPNKWRNSISATAIAHKLTSVR